MIKLITNNEIDSTLNIFCGVDGDDEWTKDSPAVFEHIYQMYDEKNYYVGHKFSSIKKHFLLVFFKKDVEYYLSLRKFSQDNCNRITISVYDWTEKTPESNVLSQISTFDLNSDDNSFHIMKVPKDTYYLFEIEAYLGNNEERFAYLNFYKNLPSGGNYVTRYYRNWEKIDGSKWSYTGKVYSQRSLHSIERNEKTEEDDEYELGVLLEFQKYKSNNDEIFFTSFDDVERRFFPSQSTIIKEFSVNKNNPFFSEQEFDYGIIRVSGYVYSEMAVLKEVCIKRNENIWIKINNQKFFVDKDTTKIDVDFDEGYNEIVAYQNIRPSSLGLEVNLASKWFHIIPRKGIYDLNNIIKEAINGDHTNYSFPALNSVEFVLKIDLEMDITITKYLSHYDASQFTYNVFRGSYPGSTAQAQKTLNLDVRFDNLNSVLTFVYQDYCIGSNLFITATIPREISGSPITLSPSQKQHFDFKIYIIRNKIGCCLMVNNQHDNCACLENIMTIPQTTVDKTDTEENLDEYITFYFNVKDAVMIPQYLTKKEISKCESIGLL